MRTLRQTSISDFSLDGALKHRGRASFAAWLDAFLRGPGRNIPLADGLLRDRRWWFGPEQFPLNRLVLKCGPGREFHEDDASWTRRTSEIAKAINGGTKLPPLIAEYRDGQLFLADGNHRHGGLELAGATHYWTAIWFNSEEDFQRFQRGQHKKSLEKSRKLRE